MTFEVSEPKINTHIYNLGSISQCQVKILVPVRNSYHDVNLFAETNWFYISPKFSNFQSHKTFLVFCISDIEKLNTSRNQFNSNLTETLLVVKKCL